MPGRTSPPRPDFAARTFGRIVSVSPFQKNHSTLRHCLHLSIIKHCIKSRLFALLRAVPRHHLAFEYRHSGGVETYLQRHRTLSMSTSPHLAQIPEAVRIAASVDPSLDPALKEQALGYLSKVKELCESTWQVRPFAFNSCSCSRELAATMTRRYT